MCVCVCVCVCVCGLFQKVWFRFTFSPGNLTALSLLPDHTHTHPPTHTHPHTYTHTHITHTQPHTHMWKKFGGGEIYVCVCLCVCVCVCVCVSRAPPCTEHTFITYVLNIFILHLIFFVCVCLHVGALRSTLLQFGKNPSKCFASILLQSWALSVFFNFFNNKK